MSQSPTRELRLQRYEDGWELINRMIREDTSWGGRERNCCHLGLGDGSFADISAASGLDYVQDGRALSRLDLDADGRPDLVLRNRNRPQLRILRNRWPHAGRALWILLEGTTSNRGAIGARVQLTTSRGVRAKEVAAGTAFLSQSSRWLCFGLAQEIEVLGVEVRWPAGRVQDLGALDPGRRWRVVEGRRPEPQPFAVRKTPGAATAVRTDADLDADADVDAVEADDDDSAPAASAGVRAPSRTWLLEPLAAPPFSWLSPDGGRRRLADFAGKPLVLRFLSSTCPVCAREIPDIVRGHGPLTAAGARLLLAAVDVRRTPEEALAFLADAVQEGIPAVQADVEGLTAWNIVHRHLFNLRRDLAVPTTFLINASGEIEKVYRGRVESSVIARDVEALPLDPLRRRALALPFGGRVLKARFERDLLDLGNAFSEASLPELARKTFSRSLATNATNLDALFNYAVSSARAGDIGAAESAYRRILEKQPAYHDARNNLGILEASAGRPAAAREHFSKVLEANPAHTEAALNLANTYLQEGRPGVAEEIYHRALSLDPESAVLRRQLGYARYLQEDLPQAIAEHLRALEIDALDIDTYLNLAILHIAAGDLPAASDYSERGLEYAPDHAGLLNTHGMALKGLGRVSEAIDKLRAAIENEPQFDRPYLNLARLHLEREEPDEARRVLIALLGIAPGHPVATDLLQSVAGERE